MNMLGQSIESFEFRTLYKAVHMRFSELQDNFKWFKMLMYKFNAIIKTYPENNEGMHLQPIRHNSTDYSR